jgi:hypothetical protein
MDRAMLNLLRYCRFPFKVAGYPVSGSRNRSKEVKAGAALSS